MVRDTFLCVEKPHLCLIDCFSFSDLCSDRENNPLDFTHPAVQTSISIITTPQREFGLLHHLQHKSSNEPIPLNCPTHLAASMGSELAHDMNAPLTDQSHSLKSRYDRDSAKLLRRKHILSEYMIKDTASVTDDVNRRPYSVWAGDVHAPISPTTVAQVSLTPPSIPRGFEPQQQQQQQTQQQQPVGSIRRRARMADSSVNVGVNRHMIFGWDDTNALVAGYWSGMETPGYDINGPDYSADTPTVSLYGTEDAATTDDLDDTEDNVSLSSMNQCEYMENFLSATASHDQSNRTLFIPDRPQKLPLAVPELLTTSATTAGSNEPEVS